MVPVTVYDVTSSERRGPAVVLRPLASDDWVAVHDWARLPQACRFQTWGPNSANETRVFVEAAVRAWREDPQRRFVHAITLNGSVIGNCELILRGNGQAEITYIVHPAHWGNGFATEASNQLLDRGFGQFGLHRIFATCDPRNLSSAAVLRKVGMKHEGRLRECKLIRDGWRDSEIFSLLSWEWNRDR